MLSSDDVTLGRNQFALLTNAIEGLLNILVEDWKADVPIARTGWESPHTTWNAIGQARGVLAASAKWLGEPSDGGPDA